MFKPNLEKNEIVNKKTKFKKFTEHFSSFRTFVVDFLIVLFIIIVLILSYRELRKDSVIIEPFQVPQELEKQNITGRGIVNKLIDQIEVIKKISSTTSGELNFIPVWSQSQLEIEVPVSGITFKSLFQNIKDFLGNKQTVINGEVTSLDDRILITVRKTGKPAATFSGNIKDSLDIILNIAAQHILKYTQPIILASYLYYQNDQNASLETIKFILNEDPADDDKNAYNLWGNILAYQYKYDEAQQKYEKAIELDPEHSDTYNNFGVMLANNKKYDEALVKFINAVELDSKNAHAYSNWGWMLEIKGEYMQAIEKYKKAMELDPKNAIALNNWGVVLAHQNKYDEAVEKYEKSSELDPFYGNGYNNWGIALENLGKYDEAIEKYKKVIELVPGDSIAIQAKERIDVLQKK